MYIYHVGLGVSWYIIYTIMIRYIYVDQLSIYIAKWLKLTFSV